MPPAARLRPVLSMGSHRKPVSNHTRNATPTNAMAATVTTRAITGSRTTYRAILRITLSS